MAKARAKKLNALKHGAHSREMILPGERETEYRALRAELYDEYQPDGVSEEFFVDDIFSLMWKKRRLESFNKVRLYDRVVQAHTDNEANRHRKVLKDLAPKFSEATSVEAVEEIFSLLNPVYVEVITRWVPCEKCKDPMQWGPAIGKYLSDIKAEVLQDPGLFAATVNPDLMEKELSRSLRLDEAIDRSIKRFFQVKIAKQMLSNNQKKPKPEPKLINPPREADGQSAGVADKGEPPAPATQAEIVVVQESVLEGSFERKYDRDPRETPVSNDVSDLTPPDTMEKVQPEGGRAKVELSAKQAPVALAKMQEFSEHCDKRRELEEDPRIGLARSV
jgi:hypothetical protein